MQEARIQSPKHLKLNEANPVSMVHTNSIFVVSLLKECNTKVVPLYITHGIIKWKLNEH